MSARLDAAVVWAGPSRFDGSPIVAIVTGLGRRSKNRKTGPVAQLWIIRSDINPVRAIELRQDYAICGSCTLRGVLDVGRICYVNVPRCVLAIYRRYARGGYPDVDPAIVASLCRAQGQAMRLGAYGDPAALPLWVLRELTAGLRHTGYTHSWRYVRPEYAGVLMASVDTPAEYRMATAAGWRTFQTVLPGQLLPARVISCPASEEAGKRTTCARCTLCDGARPGDRRASIAIQSHGNGAVHYIALRKVG